MFIFINSQKDNVICTFHIPFCLYLDSYVTKVTAARKLHIFLWTESLSTNRTYYNITQYNTKIPLLYDMLPKRRWGFFLVEISYLNRATMTIEGSRKARLITLVTKVTKVCIRNSSLPTTNVCDMKKITDLRDNKCTK